MRLFIILILSLGIVSCTSKSELEKVLGCSTTSFSELKQYNDFKKNFKIMIPEKWDTKLYYNNYQSEIFSADTIKQLTETLIFQASFNDGNVELDEAFEIKTDSLLNKSNLTRLKSGFMSFKDKPSYWYVTSGEQKGFPYHTFNLILKLSDRNYFTINSEIYGKERVEERICETISLLKTLEF